MPEAFVDTDILIRLLTGDDPAKQAQARALFEAVEAEHLVLAAPDTVIADAVFVLGSPRLYHLPRAEMYQLLAPVLRLPGFHVDNKRVLLRALEIFASTNLDFGDAMIVARMEHSGSSHLYSYDADFDRIPAITRLTPGPSGQ